MQPITPAVVEDNDVDRRVTISPAFGTLLSPGSTAANDLGDIGPASGGEIRDSRRQTVAHPINLVARLPTAEPATLDKTRETDYRATSLLSATPTTPAIIIHVCELDNKTLHIFRQAAQDQHDWARGVPTSNFPDRSQAIGGGRGMMALAQRVERCILQEEDIGLLRPPRPSARKQLLVVPPYPQSSSTDERSRNRKPRDLRPRDPYPKSGYAPVVVQRCIEQQHNSGYAPVTVQRCIEQEHNSIHGAEHHFADAESGLQILCCRIKVASQGYAARVADYISRGITSGRGRFGAGKAGGGLADMV